MFDDAHLTAEEESTKEVLQGRSIQDERLIAREIVAGDPANGDGRKIAQ